MNFWGYTIDTTLEWLALIILLSICLALYFSVIWFMRKYTTGILGGFILLVLGLFLVMGPAFHLITNDVPLPQAVAIVFTIVAGCVTLIVGAFKLTNFWDF